MGKKVGRRAEDVSGSDRDAWVAGGAIHLERGQREEEMGCFGPPERDRMFLPNVTGLSEAAWHLDAASRLFLKCLLRTCSVLGTLVTPH